MSKRGHPFNPLSPSAKHYNTATQNFVREPQSPGYKQKSAIQNQKSNDTNQELLNAHRQIELLKAEKNQLKATLKTLLERRSSESVVNLNVSNIFKSSELLSPGKPTSESELRLQRENNELRDENRKCSEQMFALRKENEAYRIKLAELERINQDNLHLKYEMEKITGELAGITSNVKRFEEESAYRMPNSSLNFKATKYINYALGLIENYDPSHFYRKCFFARFESAEKIQELLDTHQFEALTVGAFKYISDLIADPSKTGNTPTHTFSPKTKTTTAKITPLSNGRSRSPFTSAFEENIQQSSMKSPKQGTCSRDTSPQRKITGTFESAARNTTDPSRAFKKIITNISTLPSRSRDNTLPNSPTQVDTRFVLESPKQALHAGSQLKSSKYNTQQNEQRVQSPHAQPGSQSPFQRQQQGVMSPKSPSANQGFERGRSSSPKFSSYVSDNSQSRTQSLSGPQFSQFKDQQRPQSPVGLGPGKGFFYQHPSQSQIPSEYMGQFGPMYFPPQQQNAWVKTPYVQDPQYYRRQSEQVSTGIPVTLSNSFLSNYSPRGYESMHLRGQSSPTNQVYYMQPPHFSRESFDSSEVSSPHPYGQNPPQPHAYQPSPSHQRYYPMQQQPPQFFYPNYPQSNAYNHGDDFADRNFTQNVLDTQESSNYRIPTNESQQMYDARNDIASYRSSDPNVAYNQEFLPNSPTYYPGQNRPPSLDAVDRGFPQNEFVRGPDGKIYGYTQGPSPQNGTEMLSPGMYNNTPYFISANTIPKQNFEVIPEESERHNYSDSKQKHDKQLQARTDQSPMQMTTDNHEVINKATQTQTSSRSVTPTSKSSSKRENVPSLNFEALQKQRDRLIVPPINETKNQNLSRKKEDSRSFSITPKDDTPNDMSIDNSQIIQRNHNRQATSYSDNANVSGPGRATLGVMGNQEKTPKSNKKILIASSDPSLNSSVPQTFRVSFGKTQSLTTTDKPRFEAGPNDSICITEVPRKKHISPQRNFNIISNEPKPTSITPQSTNKSGNPIFQKPMNEVSPKQQFITTSQPDA